MEKFIPRAGDKCWYIYDDGSLISFIWYGSYKEEFALMDSGNLFPSKEAAEEHKSKNNGKFSIDFTMNPVMKAKLPPSEEELEEVKKAGL